jgi:hypothetical protein
MTMSTPILAEAATLLTSAVLRDYIQIYNVGDPVTVGIQVTRELIPVLIGGSPLVIRGLVQTVVLENAIESRVNTAYSVKVPQGIPLRPGQAVKVLNCVMEPELVGKVLLLDKVSQNGLAMIRKATASDFENVNQEGKGEL